MQINEIVKNSFKQCDEKHPNATNDFPINCLIMMNNV